MSTRLLTILESVDIFLDQVAFRMTNISKNTRRICYSFVSLVFSLWLLIRLLRDLFA